MRKINENYICHCGNHIHSKGFYACDMDGNEVVADENWNRLWCCDNCGKILHETTGIILGHRKINYKYLV